MIVLLTKISPKIALIKIKGLLNGLVHLIYPNICRGCGNHLNHFEKIICLSCISKIPETYFEQKRENEMFNKFRGRINTEYAFAMSYYMPGSITRSLIHSLKYENQPDIGIRLGNLTALKLMNSEYFIVPDVIIPVPIHPKKLKKRGYNQAEKIASGIAELLNVKTDFELLQKINFTQSQTKKSGFERWINVQNSFKANKIHKEYNMIMIVDDVVTTGSTIESCINSLKTELGEHIKFAVVSIAYTN